MAESVKFITKSYKPSSGASRVFGKDIVLPSGALSQIHLRQGEQLSLVNLKTFKSAKAANPVKTLGERIFADEFDQEPWRDKLQATAEQTAQTRPRLQMGDDAFVVIRSQADLKIIYTDGTQLLVPDFFNLCQTEQSCSIALPMGDKGEIYRLSGDSPQGLAWSNEGDQHVLYAHGNQQEFAQLLAQHPQLTPIEQLATKTPGQFAEISIYIPTDNAAIAAQVTPSPAESFELAQVVLPPAAAGSVLSSTTVVAGGLGLALAGGGGGGGSSTTSTFAGLVIHGKIMLGPVLAANDLVVRAYQADGLTQLGSDSLVQTATTANPYNYSIAVQGGYQGAILMRLTSRSTGLDFYTEASTTTSSVPTDLGTAKLQSVGYSDTQLSNTVTISIWTTL